MPKVSICVPAYGNPEGIKRLLESIKEQTFTDYEVVLTDDSKDDGVQKEALEAGIGTLRYFKNEKRLGATGNWNEAVRRSAGDYIKMMHHDDWFSQPDSLARFVELLDGAPDAALAFCGSWQVPLGGGKDAAGQHSAPGGPQACAARDDGRFARCISGEHEKLLKQDWRNLFLGNYIGAPSATIYRRNDQEYEEKLTWVMDMEYYMRLLQKKSEIVCTKKPLVCIGVSGGQLTEECRENGELNIFEYGFLFQEFSLADEKRYRDRLIEVALSFKQPYAALKPYRIPEAEYRAALRKKRKEDFWFLAGVAKRKILGNGKSG